MILVDPQIRAAMLAHAENCLPEESCGLLASGPDGRIRMAYPMTNDVHSNTNYTIEPREHFKALRHAEAQGWEISGVFHSHPDSAAYPSPTDVRLAPDPTWLYVVVGMGDRTKPEVRGFRIIDGEIHDETLTFQERTEQ